MTARDDRRERLERSIDHALRELPERRAPTALEGRVLREIERRAGVPWWRRRFAEWPLAARAALLTSCCASVAVVLLGSTRLAARLAAFDIQPAIAHELAGLRAAGEAMNALAGLSWRLIRSIPPEWLLGGLLATALLYAMLFALIAIGYSTLYVTSERPEAHPI